MTGATISANSASRDRSRRWFRKRTSALGTSRIHGIVWQRALISITADALRAAGFDVEIAIDDSYRPRSGRMATVASLTRAFPYRLFTWLLLRA